MLLQVLDGPGLDEDGVDGGGDQGLCPGDGAGLDGTVDQVVLGELALIKSRLHGHHVPPQKGTRRFVFRFEKT